MTDEQYMWRCIQLARQGEGRVAPNPMVGAVIVYQDRIIGEGWHQRFGGPHAEVNAINSVKDQSLLPESTLYVNLEPCAHYGKTPPCAKLIIEKRIKRVVIGMEDPNPLVDGGGIKMLLEAGVDVLVGVLEGECRWLNRYFVCQQEYERPYITLKWAQTENGIIGLRNRPKGNPLVISNPVTKQIVHQLRSQNMAIMVGTNTALSDNPKLHTTRWTGPDPLRVVIDRHLRLPANCRLLNGSSPTLVFSELEAYPFKTKAEVVRINFDEHWWGTIIQVLADRHINSLIVEGGADTLQRIIDTGYFDEVHIERKMAGGWFRYSNLPHMVFAPTLPSKWLYRSESNRYGNNTCEIYINSDLKPGLSHHIL